MVITQLISKLDPGESVTISWDQKDNNGNHVKSGTYVAIVNGITSEEQVSITTFTIKALVQVTRHFSFFPVVKQKIVYTPTCPCLSICGVIKVPGHRDLIAFSYRRLANMFAA